MLCQIRAQRPSDRHPRPGIQATRTGRKFRTNSHRAVRGPGGAWIPAQANAKVPPQIAQQKQLSGSVYGEREEDMKIDSKEFTQQRDENSLWNNKKPKNQNFLRHNQYRAPQK